MADNDFPTLVSRTTSANAVGNPLFMEMSDGTVALAKAEDTAHVSGDFGLLGLAVRRDADTSLVSADGDYSPLQVDALGSLKVSGTFVGGDVITDDAAFGIGTDKVSASGFLFDDTATDSVDEGDVGVARMTADRLMLNVIADPSNPSQRLAIDASGNAQTEVNNASGASAVNIQDGGNSITIDGTLTGITNDVSIDDGGNSITIDNAALSVVGGGVEATALRVTLANDSTGVLSIDDNGGSITVDGSVTATTGAEHNEDVSSASGDTGNYVLGVRQDTLTNDTSADGDYASFKMNQAGALYVSHDGDITIADGGNSITVDGTVVVSSITADVSIDDGGNSITVDNTALSVTGGGTETGALRVTIANDSTGLLSIDDGGGTISIDDGGGTITVDGSVTATTGAEKVEDVAHSTGDTGNFMLAVRRDADTSLVSADGDYAPLQVDDAGALKVSGSFSATGGAEKDEDTVHSTGDTGSFVLAVRNDTLATLTSADGDYSALQVDADGALYTTIRDGGNVISIDDAGGSLTVDGAVSVDDGGGSLTVDGTVTVDSITNDVSIDDGGNSITVDATQLDVDDLNLTDDAVKISGNSTANSETNPIFVQTVESVVSANEVQDYNTATVAAAATSNHDYTRTGTTILLNAVLVASSGAMKAEIQTGPLASLVTKAAAFIPSQGGTFMVEFKRPIEVAGGTADTVRVIRTNRSSLSNDVYTTIIASDV